MGVRDGIVAGGDRRGHWPQVDGRVEFEWVISRPKSIPVPVFPVDIEEGELRLTKPPR